MVLRCPSMELLVEQNLDAPPETMTLRPTADGSSFISIGFQGGGIALYELPL